jgi:hypothetical protein
MKKEIKYDPEDIESLLMHKEFSELYPEEREFVLRHIESPSEYASLRKTLHEVIDAGKRDQWLEPEPEIRENLMAQFVKEERKGFSVWLNSLFAAPQLSWYRRPAFQIAFGGFAVLMVAGILYWNRPQTEETLIAENTTKQEEIIESPSSQNANEPKSADEQLIAENLNAPVPAGTPPAPVVAQIQFTEIEVNEEVSQDVPMNENSMAESDASFTQSGEVIDEPVPTSTSKPESAVEIGTVTISSSKVESKSNKSTRLEEKEKVASSAEVMGKDKYEDESSDKNKQFSNSVSIAQMPDLLSILYTAP